MTRYLLVNDESGKWFIRRVAYNVQDDNAGEMVYHCDRHIGHALTLPEAVTLMEGLLR